jgi:lipoprotein NlpD
LKKLYWTVCLVLAGCASSPPAPVVDRAPTAKKAPAKPAAAAPQKKPTATEKDWRPDSYTVKKGDTLYSIGLEYGYDYRDIAQWNNIQPPAYRIYVGQALKLKDPKASVTATAAATAQAGAPVDSDAAVATPLQTEAAPTAKPLDNSGKTASTAPTTASGVAVPASATPTHPTSPDGVPLLNEPKALKEPYSAKAMAVEPTPKPAAKPAAAIEKTEKPADKPATTAPKPDTASSDTAPAADDDAIEWAWPVKGKPLGGFSDGGSKGLDIGGESGQPVYAAAPGKVVYSGSGLRGYGKLIIIKHNKTYLSAYAHNSQLLVKEGQVVTKGQKIAEMGNSDADRVKLHFEIRKLGKPVDPAKYLPEGAE